MRPLSNRIMATVTFANVPPSGSPTAAATSGTGNFSLGIPDNSFFVLLGPIGSGKSKLLRLVAGLDSAKGGDILIGGKSVNAIPPKDRDVAIVLPGDTLLPHLTVRGNIAAGIASRRLSAAEAGRRIENAAQLLSLSAVLDANPQALTAVQRIRAAIARAVARQPKVFLLNDPLSQLAPADRDELRPELLKLYHHLQATFLYATRDPREAMALGTDMTVLGSDLLIEQTGTPSMIFHAPANRSVAALISDPPMNFLEGTLRKDGEELIFKEASGGTLEIRLGSRPAAVEWTGKPVTLGIRPGDCEVLPASKTSGENVFQVLADVVETFGSESHFHAETGAHRLLIRCRPPEDPAGTGHRIRLRIDAARAILFDPTSGRSIH